MAFANRNVPSGAAFVGRPIRRLLAAALAAMPLLGACASMPKVGPSTSAIKANAVPSGEADYNLVGLNAQIESYLNERPARRFASTFGPGKAVPPQTIGIGDQVAVSIFEAGSSLFAAPTPIPSATPTPSAGGGSTSNLPLQTVSQDGEITVPYVGQVKIAGDTTVAAEAAIAAGLKGKVVDPQVILSVTQMVGAGVTITGDVQHPLRTPLGPAGTQLLDAIALAGGGTGPVVDMVVQVTRGSVTRRARLEEIVADPGENIYLHPGDVVFMLREQRSVVVLGTTARNAQLPFNTPEMSLAEALGNSGGLVDILSDPKGVFVFRYEPASVLTDLHRPAPVGAAKAAMVPVVYRLDMERPESFFLAQHFPMKDKDVLYVSSKRVVQLAKLIQLLRDTSIIFQSKSFVGGN